MHLHSVCGYLNRQQLRVLSTELAWSAKPETPTPWHFQLEMFPNLCSKISGKGSLQMGKAGILFQYVLWD